MSNISYEMNVRLLNSSIISFFRYIFFINIYTWECGNIYIYIFNIYKFDI